MSFSAKYYQENKERIQKKARERYQKISKKEKASVWSGTSQESRRK